MADDWPPWRHRTSALLFLAGVLAGAVLFGAVANRMQIKLDGLEELAMAVVPADYTITDTDAFRVRSWGVFPEDRQASVHFEAPAGTSASQIEEDLDRAATTAGFVTGNTRQLPAATRVEIAHPDAGGTITTNESGGRVRLRAPGRPDVIRSAALGAALGGLSTLFVLAFRRPTQT